MTMRQDAAARLVILAVGLLWLYAAFRLLLGPR